jgi:uncharacterized protein with beta-barrel porin domain
LKELEERHLTSQSQGGKLNVNGTAAKPVIMTSGLTTKAAGDWGGLVICGKAPINRITGGTGTAQSEVADLSYGELFLLIILDQLNT